jgi:hypothetical protein
MRDLQSRLGEREIALADHTELWIQAAKQESSAQIQIEKSATGFSKVCTGMTATLGILADRIVNALFRIADGGQPLSR